MFGFPDDYVITYDSNFLQEHIDSSDFEELCIPVVDTKNGNHSLIKPKKQKKKTMNPRFNSNNNNANNATHLYIDCDEYPVKLKDESKPFTSKDESKPFTSKETKLKYGKKEKKHKSLNRDILDLNRGDQIEAVKSKLSIIRHKVIPCISSIFKRTNNNCTKYNMSVIEENQNENTRTDNCCQHCNNCEQRRMRKSYKRQQNYVVQPVYAIEGNAHKTTTGPFAPTKVTEEPLQHHNRKTKDQYSSYYSHSSSSESDTRYARERQQKVKMFRKRLKTEIVKEHMKYQQQNQQIRNQQMQFPSQDNKYHVFTTPMHSRAQTLNYEDSRISEMPSSTSSFWEYLYDKTTTCGKKYQAHRVEMPAQCSCPPVAAQPMPSGRSTCCFKRNQPDNNMEMGSFGEMNGKVRRNCECKQKMPQQCQTSPCCAKKGSCDPLCTPQEPQRLCDPQCSSDTMEKSSGIEALHNMKVDDPKKKSQKTKVKCQCPEKSKLLKDGKGPKPEIPNLKDFDEEYPVPKKQGSGQQETNLKPCQEGHDEIIASLAQKYNGEILCIHNPPCILINGCLNLPPQRDQQQQNNDMSFWPVENAKHNLYHQTNNMNREQSCQYHVEVNRATDYRAEKIIQSICHHSPPCEVVRGCYKAKYDPQLENSCVHVPMCKRMPECVVVDRQKKCCEHRPRCRDIPICSRDFVMLTATENIGTQVKTLAVAERESLVCRHEPPCIMIPRCIGKAMCDSSYVHIDAIPGCVHQPSCELIPACCRKSAKEMVSVSSQYPHSCRIV